MSASTLRLSSGNPLARAIAALARRRGSPATGVGRLLGLEHEYRVLDASGDEVDFRLLLPRLPVVGRQLDPGDVHARRLAWGAALTADGREAEIALPPLAARPGAATLARDLAERARAELAGLLPPGYSLAGYSTHISVAMPTDVAAALARRYAQTFAPALMLLLDSRDAPGLLVRPRPGRLELGGDHRSGDGLRAAMLFAHGSARALAVRGRWGVPALLAVEPEPAVDRYGWYVDRAAFGPDLYEDGRSALLPLEGGGAIRAGDLLAQTWTIARQALRGMATAAELALVDGIVRGDLPLPTETERAAARSVGRGAERNEDRDAAGAPRADAGAPRAAARVPEHLETGRARVLDFRAPEGAILDDVVRPGFTLRATLATWDFAVFEVDGARRAAVSVPRSDLGAFLAAAATGVLDRRVAAFLAKPSTGAVLATCDQATGPARLYDGIGDPRGLLALEPGGGDRAAATGRAIGVAVGAARIAGGLGGVDLGGGRPGKRRPQDRRDPRHDQPSTPAPHAPSPAVVPVAAALPAIVPVAAALPPVVPAALPAVVPAIVPVAAALPLVPIALAGAGVVAVAVLAIATGVLGGRPAAATAVPSDTAPSASIAIVGTASPEPSLSFDASPAATAGPPPIGLVRVAGTYADGPDDSYHVVVTPSCPAGACDATATVLSIPFAADAPRGEITMALANDGAAYSGSGSASVPMCRTALGNVLVATQTFALTSFRATDQLLVNGQWVATTLEGTFTTGAATVTGDGATCTANEYSNTVVLHLTVPENGTTPPLEDARFSGSYRAVPAVATALSVVPGCIAGACASTMTYLAALAAGAGVSTVASMGFDGAAYAGQGTSKDLLCAPGTTVDVTLVFTGFRATSQAVIDGQWVATSLAGTVRRPAFAAPGCTGVEESAPVTLTRGP